MNTSILRTAIAMVMGTGLLVTSSAAHADSPPNGCPGGYDRLEVAPLVATGYRLAGKLDDPYSGILSHGLPGNNDGFVCGKLTKKFDADGTQLYEFTDNNVWS